MESKPFIPEKFYTKTLDFFQSKDKSDFDISEISYSSVLVKYTGSRSDSNLSMKLFKYSDQCDFEFQNIKNLTVTIMFSEPEFDEWMSGISEYGTE